MNRSVTTIHGFTLVELLCTTAIVGIVTSTALPSFYDLIAREQATSNINQHISALNFARLQAVTLGQSVTLCANGGAQECGREWAQGALIFIDKDADGKILNDSDIILRETQPLSEGSSLSWRSFGNKSYLRFTPEGFTAWQNGSFTYCPADKDNRYARQAVLNRTGRVRHAEDNNGDGVVEDSQGKNIEC